MLCAVDDSEHVDLIGFNVVDDSSGPSLFEPKSRADRFDTGGASRLTIG